MKVCVFNAKGGVGRTTLSLNLAGYFARQDKDARVLVADCHPQGSALAWAALAEETEFTAGRSRSRGFDIEILDMPPKLPDNGVLPGADLYLVPTLLDGVAYTVFLRTVSILEEQGKPFLVVANRVNKRRAEHRDRLEAPELAGAIVVHERSALATYYAEGRTVFELTGRHVPAACDELTALGLAIANFPRMRAQ